MRGMTRPTRHEYFCSTYAQSKGKSTCLRHCVNHKVIEDEIRRYLDEVAVEAATMLKTHQSGNLELLKPFEDKHWENLTKFQSVVGKMLLEIESKPLAPKEYIRIANEYPANGREKFPALDLDNLHEMVETDYRGVCEVYKKVFGADESHVKARMAELDGLHTELMQGLRTLDPVKAKRAIQKTNDEIAGVEAEMESLETRLENLTERFDETLDILHKSCGAFFDAEKALDDPAGNNRRKARAVRSAIERINLTFRPTGKKYPTCELVEIEFIPAKSEHPKGGLGSQEFIHLQAD